MQVFIENLFFKSNNSLTVVLDSLYSTPKKKKKNNAIETINLYIYIYIYNIFFWSSIVVNATSLSYETNTYILLLYTNYNLLVLPQQLWFKKKLLYD